MKRYTPDNMNAANATDSSAVAICFEEFTISEIFAELIRARGYETLLLESLDELPLDAKLITEVCYLEKLSEADHARCLVVGNKDVIKNVSTLTLSRPLTEEKIEDALHQFLTK